MRKVTNIISYQGLGSLSIGRWLYLVRYCLKSFKVLVRNIFKRTIVQCDDTLLLLFQSKCSTKIHMLKAWFLPGTI